MKPKPLLALNHFTVPCSLLTALLFSVSRGPAEHNIKLSDAPKSEPLNRAAAVFKLRSGGLQSNPPDKKIGRKCDLATALLPKGDTRATNAKTGYHRMGANARGLWRLCCGAQGDESDWCPVTQQGREAGQLRLGSLVLEVENEFEDLIGQA